MILYWSLIAINSANSGFLLRTFLIVSFALASISVLITSTPFLVVLSQSEFILSTKSVISKALSKLTSISIPLLTFFRIFSTNLGVSANNTLGPTFSIASLILSILLLSTKLSILS